MEKRSRCSLVITITRLLAARPWFDSLLGRDLSPFSNVQSFSDSNLTICLKQTEGSLPGVKKPRHEFDHLSPPSAEIKDVRAIPPLPYTSSWCAHEICYLNFTPCYTTRIPSLKDPRTYVLYIFLSFSGTSLIRALILIKAGESY